MGRLDIDTPKGQKTLQQEREAIAALRYYTRWHFIETDKRRPAVVDGIMLSSDRIVDGVYEVKSRDLTFRQLARYKFEWLITAEKLDGAIQTAKSLSVPFYGILYLVPDGLILLQKISDENGTELVSIHRRNTRTQKTVNGGSIVRLNAYVDVSTAERYPVRYPRP